VFDGVNLGTSKPDKISRNQRLTTAHIHKCRLIMVGLIHRVSVAIENFKCRFQGFIGGMVQEAMQQRQQQGSSQAFPTVFLCTSP